MKKVLVIAPHPDDETLGCGGTILRHKANRDSVSLLLVTGVSQAEGYEPERIRLRAQEVGTVAGLYGFAEVFQLGFPPAKLDSVPLGDIIDLIGQVFTKVKPDTLYLPFNGDIHSDHRVVFDAASACTKWFRYNSVKRIMCYETVSETEFAINPLQVSFRPNVFVDITGHLDSKIEIMRQYRSELADHPFPRSETNIRALAALRGASCGSIAAEGFMLIKEII